MKRKPMSRAAAVAPTESSSLILLGQLVESHAYPAFEDMVWRLNALADAIGHHPNYGELVGAIRALVPIRETLREFVDHASEVARYGSPGEVMED